MNNDGSRPSLVHHRNFSYALFLHECCLSVSLLSQASCMPFGLLLLSYKGCCKMLFQTAQSGLFVCSDKCNFINETAQYVFVCLKFTQLHLCATCKTTSPNSNTSEHMTYNDVELTSMRRHVGPKCPQGRHFDGTAKSHFNQGHCHKISIRKQQTKMAA